MLEFMGTYVGEKLLNWAAHHSFVALAGTEKDRATQQAFEEAAVGALKEVCDSSSRR